MATKTKATKVPSAIVDALIAEGVTADTKATTFKGTYKELTGESLDAESLEEHRQAVREKLNADPESTVPAAKNVAKTARKQRPPKTDAKARKATKAPKAVKQQRSEKVPLTEDERIKSANAIMKQNKADGRKGWENVTRITKISDNGKPLQVVIRCSIAGCKNERTIAVQDVFQVNKCVECQKVATREYRNELSRRRRAAKAPEAAAKPAKKAAPKKAKKAGRKKATR